MRVQTALAVLLLVCPAASAEAADVDRIELLGKGIYQLALGEAVPDAGAPTGSSATPTAVTLVEATATIPARIGVEFGLEYRIVGAPDGSDVSVDIVTIYPAAGLASPGNSEPLRESRYQRTKKLGEAAYVGYGFEEDWELVGGTWSFQIWHEGRKLLDESFAVTGK